MDSYKIGVSIALANGMSPILQIISRDLLGVHSKIKDIENSFGKWAVAVGSTAAIMGGTALLGGMAKLVEHGRELVHQQEMMKLAGMSNKEIAEATATAYDTSAKVQSTTISENLKHLRELRYAFGNTEAAQQHIEQVSKANAILNSVKGGSGDQVWELVKSLEQKGETANPAAFMRYVDIMTKAVEASGGRVTPAQFFSSFKYGRTAMLGWDETFIGQYLPRLIQSMSGGGGGGSGGPGNALMSAFAKVVQGQMPKKAAEEFERMGLVNGRILKAGGGQFTIEGGIKDSDQFQHNPYEWVQSVLMPTLAKHGITSQERIIDEISKLFPVRTASQVIAEMGLQGRFHEGVASPFEKDASLNRAALPTDQAFDEINKHDPTQIMKAFTGQWHSMLEALGSPLVGPSLDIMRAVTGVFTSVTQFAGAHPEAIRTIGIALGSLAVGLIAIGGVALASLVSLPVLLTGLALAIGAVVGVTIWGPAVRGLHAIGDAISWFATWIADKAKTVLGVFGIHGAANDNIKTPNFGHRAGPGYDASGVGFVPMSWTPNDAISKSPSHINAIPPASKSTPQVTAANVYLDNRKVGEMQVRYLADGMSRPAHGSPYFDSTRGTESLDLAQAA